MTDFTDEHFKQIEAAFDAINKRECGWVDEGFLPVLLAELRPQKFAVGQIAVKKDRLMTNEFDELIERAQIEASTLHDYSQREGGKVAYDDACLIDDLIRWLKWYREGVEAFIDIDENFPILPRSQGFAHQLDRVEEYAQQLQEGPRDDDEHAQ